MFLIIPVFAQENYNPFMEPIPPRTELLVFLKSHFSEATVTHKTSVASGQMKFRYELLPDAIVIYRHAVLGSSASDETYQDKWFYIPFNDLYVVSDDTIRNYFNESVEITITNKMKRIMAGNGTMVNLADKNIYHVNQITFPINTNGIFNFDIEIFTDFITKLRTETSANTVNSESTQQNDIKKSEEVKPVLKKTYYTSGELQSEVPLVNDQMHGIRKYYYTSKELRGETIYVNGKKEGLSKIFYKSGKIEFITIHKNDLKEGVEKGYYETGQLKSTMEFKNGKANGPIDEFYTNGSLKSSSKAVDGHYNEYMMKWSEKGDLIEKKYYVLGRLSGTLHICEGVNFLAGKLKNKEFEKLDDDDWMEDNYDGIKAFNFDYFSEGYTSGSKSTSFLNKPYYCSSTYLPEFKSKKEMYTVYKQFVSYLDACNSLQGKVESVLSGGEMATFRYDKNITVTITASEYNMKIVVKVIRKAD